MQREKVGDRQKELRVCDQALCSLAFTPHHGVGFAASQAPVGIPAVSSSPMNKVIKGFIGILWLGSYTFLVGLQ